MTKNEINRREFIRVAGATGIGIAAGGVPAAAKLIGVQTSQQPLEGFAAPKIDSVRMAFIGVGARGSGHVAQMLMLDGVEIKAICDTHEPTARASVKRCTDKGRPEPALYTNGPDDFKNMLDRADVDAVMISTPWEDHVDRK